MAEGQLQDLAASCVYIFHTVSVVLSSCVDEEWDLVESILC